MANGIPKSIVVPLGIQGIIAVQARCSEQKYPVSHIIEEHQFVVCALIMSLNEEDRALFDHTLLWKQQQFP
jgi:hypothetical protein